MLSRQRNHHLCRRVTQFGYQTSISELCDTLGAMSCAAQPEDEWTSVEFAAVLPWCTDPMIVESPEGVIIRWNLACEQLLGWSEREAAGHTLSDFMVPDDTDPEKRRNVGPLAPFLRHKTGTSISVAISVSPVYAGDGRLLCTLKVLRSLMERRGEQEEAGRYTAALRGSEAWYRLLLDTIPHMVWTTDAAGTTNFMNRRAVAQLNLTDGVLGWGWLEWLHPDDVERSRRVWDDAVRNHSPYRNEYQLRHPDGSYRWYLSQAVPLPALEGSAEMWVGTWTDIHEAKVAQEALRASEERFRQIAESIREVFWLTDTDKIKIAYVSPAYEAIWGRSTDSLYATPNDWLSAIHPEDRSRVEAASLAGKQLSGEYSEEYRIVRPDGAIRWIRDQAFPVRDEQGQAIRIAGVAEDITEQRELEEHLRQAQKMEAIGQLAGGVAHDFNNLLTIINGYSQLLLESVSVGDPRRHMLEEIRKAGDLSAALTRQLLAFSRRQVLSPQVININEVIKNTEEMLRRLIGEDVRLTTILEPNLGNVKADAGQVEQVLLNLAVNGRDAMPNGGELKIETGNVELDEQSAFSHGAVRPGRYVALTITDSGIGMTEEVKRHIFEPFFTTKGPGRGTGLGLAVVHGFVQQSEGHVEVHSQETVGTWFRVYLPQVDDTQPHRSGQSAPLLNSGGTETILLVEDQDAVRTLTLRILEARGYKVWSAANAEEALRLFESHKESIQLLVTDLAMPGMGGNELAQRLQTAKPELKVLYLSGYTDEMVVREGVLQHEANFLQKPFSPLALAEKVREVLV